MWRFNFLSRLWDEALIHRAEPLICVCHRELELSSVSETTEGEGLSLHHAHLVCPHLPPKLPPRASAARSSSSSQLLFLSTLSQRPLTPGNAHSPNVSPFTPSSCFQPRNLSASNKFASEPHTPAGQGHFRGVLLHKDPPHAPPKSPNDLQLSQVVSENE